MSSVENDDKHILKLLLETTTVLISNHNEKQVLDQILQGVRAIGFDRVRLYLLSDDQQLLAKAQAGMDDGFVGFKRSIENDEYMQVLINDPRPHLFKREPGKLVPFEEQLVEGGVDEWVCAPLILHGKIIGKLSVDNKVSRRPVNEKDIYPLALFASQAAAAIENARRFEKISKREHLLDALVEASRKIRAVTETPNLMQEIVRLAAELVDSTAGGLCINRSQLRQLEVSVVYGIPDWPVETNIHHTDGLIGRVARTGKTEISYDGAERSGRESILEPFKRVVAVPIFKRTGEVEAVLFVGNKEDRQQFTRIDIEVLERFAAQAFIALQTARLVNQEQLKNEQLSTLHKISDYIQATDDINKILHMVLTGVTADYGLRFNRAVLLLLDEQQKHLVGRMGIGQFELRDAREAWTYDRMHGLDNFAPYLRSLEQDKMPQTPVGKWASELRLPVSSQAVDAFSRAVFEQKCIVIDPDELSRLPISFKEKFEATTHLVLVPLTAPERTIGLLVVDNKFTQSRITDDTLDLLATFANTAAIAIDKAQLLHENRVARENLRSSFEASTALVSAGDPAGVLEEIVAKTPLAAKAAWVRLILIDELGRAQMQIIKGMDRHLDITQAIRPDGISRHVMRSGSPERINNTMEKKDKVNPFLLENGIAAALCLPFSLHGKPIGVMWINYDKPRHFPDYEVDALQLYVNQAAIAYENARRVKELNQLHQAAEAMSGKHDLKSLLRTIVEEAAKMFDAASSTVWPYDYDKKKFIPKDATSIGIPEDELEVLKNIEPVPGGTTFSALERGWLGVHDISDPSYEFLRESTRDLLERNGLKSFQAITLRVGEEPVGVLYVSYAQMRAFRKEDRSALESFATYAALSLKNGKLLDQLKRAKKAAKVVAQVTALGRPEEKLPSIADGTLEAVGCDAVVLYAYDPSRGKFIYPPTHAGVKYPKDAWPDDKMPSSSIVFKIFGQREPRIAERVEQDPLLKDRRFSRVEEIKSCVAIPLQAGNQSVGVMFVNYREPHRFTADDLSNIELFAYQAAVAIRNAQLFSEQESLMKLSRELLGTVSLPGAVSMPGILDRAVATAASMLNTEFCDIVLPDNERNLTIRAAVGAKKDLVGTKVGPDSHTAYIISEKKPVPVDDYYNETRFTPPSTVTDYEIKSGLGVPMFKGGDRMHVLGAMLVQTRSVRHFDDGEINLLSLIANLTAIAIQSAEQYAELQQRERHLLAVLTASDQKEVLDRILEEAVERIRGTDGEKAIFATFQHYDKESNSLTFTNAYPQANPLMVQVGDKVSLESTHRGKKIGVTGRAALTRKPQLVPVVTLDPDYFESYPGICSEIAVPVLDDDTLIGVLNIEHRKLNAFNEHDRDALQYLADLAVVAIRIAEQAEKLIQAREIAAMGIWYAELTHDIEAGVGNIRETIMIAEQYNPQEKIQHLLQSLDDAAEKLRIPRLPLRPSFADKASQQIEALLDKIVEDEVNLHRTESPWIDFKPELNCPNARVAIDPMWLNRLVRHFLLNATQNMPREKEDRRIIIRTKTHGNFAEIEVEDTGKGVPPELHAYLFRPNPNRNQRGRGLLLVRYIAECHGGRAYYRPGDSGQGSCFALRLPLAN